MAADWKELAGDSKEKYGLYLASREWSILKRAVHRRAGGRCERCGESLIDAVHHLTYERKYAEKLDDLQGTCRACHQFIHGHSDDDPAIDYGEWIDVQLDNAVATAGVSHFDDSLLKIDSRPERVTHSRWIRFTRNYRGAPEIGIVFVLQTGEFGLGKIDGPQISVIAELNIEKARELANALARVIHYTEV